MISHTVPAAGVFPRPHEEKNVKMSFTILPQGHHVGMTLAMGDF